MNDSPTPDETASGPEVGRRSLLRMGAGAAMVAAVHPVASAVSQIGSHDEDLGFFGTVKSVTGGDSIQLELRESGDVVNVHLSRNAVSTNGIPSVGQWITVFGSRAGDAISDAEFIFVSEFLPAVEPGDLKSKRFRFSSKTFKMRFRGDAPETASSRDLPPSSTDVVAVRAGDGTYEVIAVGDHPKAP